MKFFNLLSYLVTTAAITHASPLEERNCGRSFVGYLISTFSDAVPKVQFYLSKGNTPSEYTFVNKGQPILTSTVGSGAVRDLFLASNDKREVWYLIATDLDVKVPGFTWKNATRHGSRGIVVWKSTNLVDWSTSRLAIVEGETAGMVWAPSAVWDTLNSQWFVFWASRFYDPADVNHEGPFSRNRIRYATTSDFITFSEPKDYYAPDRTAVIDQEFQYLGEPGHYARWFKNESVGYVYQETTTTGLFGQWTKLPGFVHSGGQREGPAAFQDNKIPGKYYLLLDDYKQYIPYETDNILSGKWNQATSWTSFPKGLKHGSVTPVTQEEFDRLKKKYID